MHQPHHAGTWLELGSQVGKKSGEHDITLSDL